MARADGPVALLGGVQQAGARGGGLLLVGVHARAPGRLGNLGNAVQHIAHHHAALPVGVDQHHLVARRVAGGKGDGNFVVDHVFRFLQNLLEAQAAQGHHLPVNVGVALAALGGGEPVVVGAGHNVAGPPEVGRRHPPGVAQVPAHMVAMQVRVDDIVDRIAGAHVGVVDAHVGLQVRAQLLVEVARAVPPVGVRARPHARVHQDDIVLAFEQKDAVIELELAVLQRVRIVGPGAGGDIGEHRGRLAGGRHHINDGGDLHIADGCLVCHYGNPPHQGRLVAGLGRLEALGRPTGVGPAERGCSGCNGTGGGRLTRQPQK